MQYVQKPNTHLAVLKSKYRFHRERLREASIKSDWATAARIARTLQRIRAEVNRTKAARA